MFESLKGGFNLDDTPFLAEESIENELSSDPLSPSRGSEDPKFCDEEGEVEDVMRVVHWLEDKKAMNIIAIDVRGLSQITDFFIIAEGNVVKHLEAMAQHIYTSAKRAHMGASEWEGRGDSWQVVDLGGVIVHLMTAHMRQLYQLEKLWGRGRRLDIAKQVNLDDTEGS